MAAAAGAPPPGVGGSRTFAQVLAASLEIPQADIEVHQPAFTDRGERACFFGKTEIDVSLQPLLFTVVAKTSYGRPAFPEIRTHLTSRCGLKDSFVISALDNSHLLFRFKVHDDYLRVLLRESIYVQGKLFRFFKWSPLFKPEEEPSICPIWIEFPGLPVNLYQKKFLMSIACNVGPVLQIAQATEHLLDTRAARVCVELDLLLDRPERIWIGMGPDFGGFWQEVTYVNLPYYCTSCRKLGHQNESCKGKPISKPTPPATQKGSLPQAVIKETWVQVNKGKQVVVPATRVLDGVSLGEGSSRPLLPDGGPPAAVIPDSHPEPMVSTVPIPEERMHASASIDHGVRPSDVPSGVRGSLVGNEVVVPHPVQVGTGIDPGNESLQADLHADPSGPALVDVCDDQDVLREKSEVQNFQVNVSVLAAAVSAKDFSEEVAVHHSEEGLGACMPYAGLSLSPSCTRNSGGTLPAKVVEQAPSSPTSPSPAGRSSSLNGVVSRSTKAGQGACRVGHPSNTTEGFQTLEEAVQADIEFHGNLSVGAAKDGELVPVHTTVEELNMGGVQISKSGPVAFRVNQAPIQVGENQSKEATKCLGQPGIEFSIDLSDAVADHGVLAAIKSPAGVHEPPPPLLSMLQPPVRLGEALQPAGFTSRPPTARESKGKFSLDRDAHLRIMETSWNENFAMVPVPSPRRGVCTRYDGVDDYVEERCRRRPGLRPRGALRHSRSWDDFSLEF